MDTDGQMDDDLLHGVLHHWTDLMVLVVPAGRRVNLKPIQGASAHAPHLFLITITLILIGPIFRHSFLVGTTGIKQSLEEGTPESRLEWPLLRPSGSAYFDGPMLYFSASFSSKYAEK